MRPRQRPDFGLSPAIWIAIFLAATSFLLNRHIVRPWVIQNTDYELILILVNSLPNLVEAITGTIMIAGLLLVVRPANGGSSVFSDDSLVYALATLIAGLFVFASELNWIQFRGPNVRDAYDLAASALGLVLVYFLMRRFGLYDRRDNHSVSTESQNDRRAAPGR